MISQLTKSNEAISSSKLAPLFHPMQVGGRWNKNADTYFVQIAKEDNNER